MELYNKLIEDTKKLLEPYQPTVWKTGGKAWEQTDRNDIIFASDTAYELGGGGKPSATFTVVTSSDNLIEPDTIKLYGKDFCDIKSNTPFAQLVFVQVEDFEDDAFACYNAIRDIELMVYEVLPKEIMVRISALDRKEQMRVSKSAIKNKVSFESIGNAYANKFKTNPKVKSVSILYLTQDMPIYDELVKYAKKIDDITLTLNHVLNDMNFDCANCNLREICNEVEGLRQLHFKNKEKK